MTSKEIAARIDRIIHETSHRTDACWEIAYQLAVLNEREAELNAGLLQIRRTANVNPESPKPAPEVTQSILDQQFADFVSTEPLEVIKDTECDPGDLAGSRFRRVFNEIAQLRQAKK